MLRMVPGAFAHVSSMAHQAAGLHMSSTAAASNTEQDSSSKSTSSGSILPHPTDFYSLEKYRGRKFATERLQLNVALDWGRCGGTKTDTTSSLERISANSSAQTELQQHSVLLGTAPVRLQVCYKTG